MDNILVILFWLSVLSVLHTYFIFPFLLTLIQRFYQQNKECYSKEELPFVTCKLAISKDYYLNDSRTKNITNDYSRARGHLLRNNHDCILSSSSTVIDDNPKFTCRILGLEDLSPARIILDSGLKIPIKHNLILLGKKYRTIIFYNKGNKKKIKKLKKMKIKLIKSPLNESGLFDLKKNSL